jgi:choline dehydrogenase-like flavoprotein
LGAVKYYDDVINASKKLELRPNWHPMGTLRMGEPGKSVVDRNLMLHGVENVYVLSSAVFPTGSNQNPVFTTLALGSRLADHITKKS